MELQQTYSEMKDQASDMYDRYLAGEPNLHWAERAASVGFGLAMAAAGLRKQGILGALMGVGGGVLALRGMTGHCAAKEWLTHRNGHGHGNGHARVGKHEEAGEEQVGEQHSTAH